MHDSLHLTCDNCHHKFWFDFTCGCMRTGQVEIICEGCQNKIYIKEGPHFDGGYVGLLIEGAIRGLFLSIGWLESDFINELNKELIED